MKHLLKLVGSLLLDQFMGTIAGSMMVLCVYTFFKNSLTGYILAFIFCFIFYAYATYNSAFKSGFHDSHRAIKDTAYRGYWYKGAISGLISAVPLAIVYIIYLTADKGITGTFYMIMNMYWTWPMINIFPNHIYTVMPLVIVPLTVIPWLGYIMGYKTIFLTDVFLNLYQKFFPKKP